MRITGLALKRATRILLRQNRMFVVCCALGGAALLLLSSVVGVGAQRSSDELSSRSALTLVQVNSNQRGQTKPVNQSSLDAFAKLPGVVHVFPWAQTGLMSESRSDIIGEDPMIAWATTRLPFGQPAAIGGDGRVVTDLEDDQIVLPDAYGGRSLTPLLGSSLRFSYQMRVGDSEVVGKPLTLTVVATYDSLRPGDNGPGTAYVNANTSLRLAAADQGVTTAQLLAAGPIPRAYVQVDGVDRVSDTERALNAAGYTASSVASQVDRLPQALSLLSMLGLIILGVLVLFTVATGASLGSGYVHNRMSEVGLLRAMGWRRSRVLALFASELLAVGAMTGILVVLLGIVASLAAGFALNGRSLFGVEYLGATMLPTFGSLAAGLLLPALALLAGAAAPLVRAASVDPDVALRALAH